MYWNGGCLTRRCGRSTSTVAHSSLCIVIADNRRLRFVSHFSSLSCCIICSYWSHTMLHTPSSCCLGTLPPVFVVTGRHHGMMHIIADRWTKRIFLFASPTVSPTAMYLHNFLEYSSLRLSQVSHNLVSCSVPINISLPINCHSHHVRLVRVPASLLSFFCFSFVCLFHCRYTGSHQFITRFPLKLIYCIHTPLQVCRQTFKNL